MKPLLPVALLLLATSAWAVNDQDSRGDHPDTPPHTPEQEKATFHLPPGFEIQLVAAEPEIQKPINITFDGAGRLWVTGSEMYPWPAGTDALGDPIPNFAKAFADIANAFHSGPPAPPPSLAARDTIRVLGDFAPDGHARKISVFADGLNIPGGCQPLPRKPGSKGDTVIAYSIPGIWSFEDTEGDGHAHVRKPLFKSFGFLDTHGGSASYLYWIDGWIYGTHGFRNHSEIRDGSGVTTVLDSGHTYRFRPDGSHFEIYTHGQTNPFGLSVDSLGNFYSADSHSRPVYMLLRGGWYEGIGKQHDGLGFGPRTTNDGHGSTAIAGMVHYDALQFPAEYRGNTFNGNVVTQKINRDRMDWHGSTPKAERMPDFLTCDDPWFRPVNVKLGPDGALYVADFYNPIIGHYEFPLTDPRRDHAHGRIWRIVWRGEHQEVPQPAVPDLSVLDADALVQKFYDPNLVVRTLATNELVDRIGPAALPALKKLIAAGAPASGSGPNRTPESLAVAHALWAVERLTGSAGSSAEILAKPVCAPLELALLRDRPATPADPGISPAALNSSQDAFDRRALTDLLGKHPHPGQIETLLRILTEAAPDDAELIYSARLALRDNLIAPGGYTEALELAHRDPASTARLADVSLGAKTPEAADFLLQMLEGSNLSDPRDGEYLRHAVLQAAPERLASLAFIPEKAQGLPLPQRLALAENLGQAARQRGLHLPEKTGAWVRDTLIAALSSPDEGLLKRAIESVRELPLEAKFEPLSKLVADTGRTGPMRISALEALANLPQSGDVLAQAIGDPSSISLRKRAGELLGQSKDAPARAALLAALPTAPGDLATVIAAGLAKSASGAESLLATIESGKASAGLLHATLVAAALEKQSAALRDRAAKLAADVPPEDTRLDGVIARRVEAYRKAQPDAVHGAEVFKQTCAICHQIKNQGANIGPALDGIGARGLHRVMEDILDPNRNVDPMFRQTIVETADGQTLAGLNPRTEGELLVLSDATGKQVSVPKAGVKTQTQSKLSLMPVGFENAIPPADFNDLLAYLFSK